MKSYSETVELGKHVNTTLILYICLVLLSSRTLLKRGAYECERVEKINFSLLFIPMLSREEHKMMIGGQYLHRYSSAIKILAKAKKKKARALYMMPEK